MKQFFRAIDIKPIFAVVTKKPRFGRPAELNYAAMIYSLIARLTERIPFIKDLVKRLKSDMIFRLDCGFLVSDTVPSKSSLLKNGDHHSNAWKKIFKSSNAVERVNAYLKLCFQLNNVRYRTGKRTKVQFDLVTFVYPTLTGSKTPTSKIRGTKEA